MRNFHIWYNVYMFIYGHKFNIILKTIDILLTQI